MNPAAGPPPRGRMYTGLLRERAPVVVLQGVVRRTHASRRATNWDAHWCAPHHYPAGRCRSPPTRNHSASPSLCPPTLRSPFYLSPVHASPVPVQATNPPTINQDVPWETCMERQVVHQPLPGAGEVRMSTGRGQVVPIDAGTITLPNGRGRGRGRGRGSPARGSPARPRGRGRGGAALSPAPRAQ